MYSNYGKLFTYCGPTDDVKLSSTKFVEPNLQAYLKVNITRDYFVDRDQEMENPNFAYGRIENISGYRFNPAFNREGTDFPFVPRVPRAHTDDTKTNTTTCTACGGGKDLIPIKKIQINSP